MYQLSPDWKHTWTVNEAEKEMEDFKFKGPGMYLYENSTIVVIAIYDPSEKYPWKQKWPKNQLFQFNVYNCHFLYTIFGSKVPIPNRKMENEND